jgi:hypothetical protein
MFLFNISIICILRASLNRLKYDELLVLGWYFMLIPLFALFILFISVFVFFIRRCIFILTPINYNFITTIFNLFRCVYVAIIFVFYFINLLICIFYFLSNFTFAKPSRRSRNYYNRSHPANNGVNSFKSRYSSDSEYGYSWYVCILKKLSVHTIRASKINRIPIHYSSVKNNYVIRLMLPDSLTNNKALRSRMFSITRTHFSKYEYYGFKKPIFPSHYKVFNLKN